MPEPPKGARDCASYKYKYQCQRTKLSVGNAITAKFSVICLSCMHCKSTLWIYAIIKIRQAKYPSADVHSTWWGQES